MSEIVICQFCLKEITDFTNTTTWLLEDYDPVTAHTKCIPKS